MNTLKTLFVIILLSASISFAQEDANLKNIKISVDKLFNFCKSDDFKSASVLMAFSGKDSSRYLSDSYNMNDLKEASTVKRIAKKIKAFLSISDKYTFGKFENKTENGKVIFSLEIVFESGNQQLKTMFSFVNVKGVMLLADLN